ncbi:MAG: hypothetical protein IJA72_00870 [Clostridia bacterium]|nr:hypothetical protein [Clostridia bacterium]
MNFITKIHPIKIKHFVRSLDSNIQAVHLVKTINGSVNAFTDTLDNTYYISDYECINLENGQSYSKELRRFMIAELDKIQLGDVYIDCMHDYLEQDTIVGAIL